MANVLTTAFAANPLTDAIIERFMYQKVLSIAMKSTVYWKLGRMVTIPRGESKTITFQRFERLVAPRRPLTEGVTPGGKKMRVTKVPAIAEQWGDFVTLTDVVELTVRHEPFQRALELIGLDAAMTVDREVQRVLKAGTNLFFPNKRTSRAQLVATDVLTTPLLRRIIANLKNGGAPAYEGNRYVGVVDPFESADIQADSTFVPAAQYSNLSALQDAEIGVWQNVRWMESNNMPILTQDSNANPSAVATDTASAGETNLPNAATGYDVALIGLDTNGFEVMWSATPVGPTVTSSQVLKVTLPALPDGIFAFNVYVKNENSNNLFYLTAEDQAGSAVIYINGGGTHLTSDDANDGSFTFSESTLVMGTQPPAGINVHYGFIFGNEYYSCTELSGIQVLRTPAGPQKTDELDQRRSIGWKAFFKAVITNEAFGCRFECASANQ
jgi:N4-gp56 family major capsid protein